jgi:hypothetical protein
MNLTGHGPILLLFHFSHDIFKVCKFFVIAIIAIIAAVVVVVAVIVVNNDRCSLGATVDHVDYLRQIRHKTGQSMADITKCSVLT